MLLSYLCHCNFSMVEKNNIFSISEHTGYSASTVSRVLSGKAQKYRISQKAVSIITQEAERCHYRPNLLAQSLRTRKTHTIGLLVPGIENPFFSNLAAILINLLDARGYRTILADSRESADEELQELEMLQRGGVDGIICVPVSESPEVHEKVSVQIPMVLIDRYFRDTTLPYVCTDNYTGAKMAAELLLKKEYKCILAIQGVPGSIPNQERVSGFVDTLEGHHVDFDIVGNAFSIENGYRETCRAFGKKKYDAVFAFSATILLGVLKALRERNRQIGKDVGVVSYDNNGFLEFMEPAITCIEQPLRENAELAVASLFSIIEARNQGAPDPEILQQLMPPLLIERDSC